MSLPENNVGSLAVGSFVGGTYRVLEFVGQGGMGFVYKVEHMMMAKVMAMKVLKSEQVSGDVWKRFRTEAQAIARLNHANVVRIYDMSQTDEGLPFYTMDLLEGQSLADYLDEYEQMPVAEALPIFRQVASGLAYAHDRGIIHRDIKPGNIMLLPQAGAPPVVKIVDFGIAKLSSFDGVGQGLTRPGEVFGSPLYMSPEQCSGKPLDHRTDTYSVGVTMFQMLTGRPPLLGKTAIETTAMHQSTIPPSMSQAATDREMEFCDFPDQLEEMVACLLAKKPDDRYDSLADIVPMLLALERGEVTNAAGKKGRRVLSAEVHEDTFAGAATTGSESSASMEGKGLLIAGAAILVLGLAGALGMAAFFLVQVKPNAPAHVEASTDPSVQANSAGVTPIKSVTEQRSLQNIDLSTASEVGKSGEQQLAWEAHLDDYDAKAVAAYLKSHKGAYSHVAVEGNRRVKIFEFPTTFSLGSLGYKNRIDSQSGTFAARGRIVIPFSSETRFICHRATIDNPELLKFFQPDDISWLSIINVPVRVPGHLPAIAHLTGLYRLDLRKNPVTDQDIALLDRLPNLTHLNVDLTECTGVGLAKLRLLKRLIMLEMESLKERKPALEKLLEGGVIYHLSVSGSTLSDAELELIARMKSLRLLSLKDTAITDKQLAIIAPLKKLTLLDLTECFNLSSKSVPTLKALPNLEDVRLPVEYTLKDYDELKRTLPHLKNLK